MRARRWLSSTALIFYGLILGVALGALFPAETHPAAYETFRFMSKAFINLIKMLIVPLIFSTIVVGIGKTGDVKAVGRMGVKALIYFEVATTAALALGLGDRAPRAAGRRPDASALGRAARAAEDVRRDAAAPLPLQRRGRDGQAGHPPGRRLRDPDRRRGGARQGEVGPVPQRHGLDRRGDVPAHGLRDGADAARRLRRDGGRGVPPRPDGARLVREARGRRSTARSSSSRCSS